MKKSTVRVVAWAIGFLALAFGAYLLVDTWWVVRSRAQPHLVLGSVTEAAYPGPCHGCYGEVVVLERQEAGEWTCEEDATHLANFDIELSAQYREEVWQPLRLDTGWQTRTPAYGPTALAAPCDGSRIRRRDFA